MSSIDVAQAEILPDSRSRESRDQIQRAGVWWVRCFCSSCGKRGGIVPADCQGVCYLCNDCAGKYGIPAGLMVLPIEKWWAAVDAEMMATYGRILNPEELSAVETANTTPLAKLLRERPL